MRKSTATDLEDSQDVAAIEQQPEATDKKETIMTHFTVLACVKSPAALEDALAPYDEGLEAEPRRDYETGLPSGYWAVRDLREKGTLNPDDATLTWEQVAAAVNAEYHQDGDDDGRFLIDPDDGRVYTITTSNAQSTWDWWVIGGRWGGALRYKEGHAAQVLQPQPHWSESDEVFPSGSCDGGPKHALDLEAVRAEAAGDARKRFREYQELVAGTPEAVPFRVYADNVSEGNGYTIERAREEYHSQPRVAKLKEAGRFDFFSRDAIEFSVSEDEYARRAQASAVPGYALLTREGQWIAPGTMGWWGMSSDDQGSRDVYLAQANAYIDNLPDDVWLIMVDAHV
jgi:hypothetical protein